MRDQDGEPLDVVTLPMPRPMHYEGQRLPASYANFYIANKRGAGGRLSVTSATAACSTRCSGCFPDREVVGIDCTRLVWGLGAIHCVTQQQPAC